jgi:hypothetical protein
MRVLIFLVALLLSAPAAAQTWTTAIENGGRTVTDIGGTNKKAYFFTTTSRTSPVLAIGKRRVNVYFDNDRTATDAACTADLYWCGDSADVIGSGCNAMGFLAVGGSSATNTLTGASGVNGLFNIEAPDFLIVDVTNATVADCQVYVTTHD